MEEHRGTPPAAKPFLVNVDLASGKTQEFAAMSIRRIAQLAGISPGAVSLALRESPKISEAMRRRVRQLADQIGYRPSAKIAELMSTVRARRESHGEGCFGVISLYPNARPWEGSEHLTRIYASMNQRAYDLGYRLEPLWLRAPGMTYRRFRSILDARGIQGLLCFGSSVLDDPFPAELDHYAVVTVGLSIQTPLHRVTSHFYNDTTHALNKVHTLGYRRPGLVLSRYEEGRSAYAHSSAYLGWWDRQLQDARPIPVLRLDKVEERPLLAWLHRHQPDVVIFVHLFDALEKFSEILRRHKIAVPGQLGVAAVSHHIEATRFSGMQQNQQLMGEWAVELLVARIMHHDFGIPAIPRLEMVESRWVDGTSLRARKPARSSP
jgi:DNA-binding LacI/PurR family transcriptional regulator